MNHIYEVALLDEQDNVTTRLFFNTQSAAKRFKGNSKANISRYPLFSENDI